MVCISQKKKLHWTKKVRNNWSGWTDESAELIKCYRSSICDEAGKTHQRPSWERNRWWLTASILFVTVFGTEIWPLVKMNLLEPWSAPTGIPLTDCPPAGNYTARSAAGGTAWRCISINLHVSLGPAAASGILSDYCSYSMDNLFKCYKKSTVRRYDECSGWHLHKATKVLIYSVMKLRLL